MKNVIWKYKLNLGAVTEVDLPQSAKVIHFDVDPLEPGAACMWVLRDAADTEGVGLRYLFYVAMTGEEIEGPVEHYGTAIMRTRFPLVLHLLGVGPSFAQVSPTDGDQS